MGLKSSRTCILDDPISQIINEILIIGFIFIVLFLIVIIQFSRNCPCVKTIEGTKNIISAMETKSLMVIQNQENDKLSENKRLLKALEAIAENIIVRPTLF